MSRVLKQGENPPSRSPWFFRVTWRFCLIICAVISSLPALSASICDEKRLSGECYRVNSSGQFWAYGAFLPQSRDTLLADYSGARFNLSRIRYKRQPSWMGSEFEYDRYLVQTKKYQLVLFREEAPLDLARQPSTYQQGQYLYAILQEHAVLYLSELKTMPTVKSSTPWAKLSGMDMGY